MFSLCPNRENKLQKEHDIACNRLKDWKKRFENTLNEYLKKIKDFNAKDRMSEADKYMAELKDIGQKIEEFKDEVSFFLKFTYVLFL